MIPPITDASASVAAIAAGVAGLIYLGRRMFHGVKLVDRLAHLVEHELTHNGGSSMKDDLHAIAVHTGRLEAEFHDLAQRVETLEALGLLGYKMPAHHRKDYKH